MVLASSMRTGPARKLLDAIVNRWSWKLPRKMQLQPEFVNLDGMLYDEGKLSAPTR